MSIIITKDLTFLNKIKYNNINIKRNKITFITGKSGTGKSSLLKIFNGTNTQSSGHVFFNGEETLKMDTLMLRQKILLVSQSSFLFEGSIKSNFEKFYEMREIIMISDEKIKEFLNICGIDFELDKDCANLSGGEKQRVYTGIYLSFATDIFMLDEPTSALDKENGLKVIKNIMNYCKKMEITVIVVSHDNNLTEKFADEIINID